jgi:hypothetical protein
MLTGLPSLTAGAEASPELPPPQPLTKTSPTVIAIKLRFIVARPSAGTSLTGAWNGDLNP